METTNILEELLAATGSEAKAALIAESVLSDLPPSVAVAARRCGFLPWFNQDIAEAMLSDTDRYFGSIHGEREIQLILDLPFVEHVPWGYTFHDSTRKGLLDRYSLADPGEIVAAWKSAIPVLLRNWDDDDAALSALYGLLLTRQKEEGKNRFDALFSRFMSKGEDILVSNLFRTLDDVEAQLGESALELDSMQWVLRSISHMVTGNLESAILDCNRAIEEDAGNVVARLQRGVVMFNLGNLDSALSDFDHVVELDPSGSAGHHLRGIVLFRKNQLDASLLELGKAVEIDAAAAPVYLDRSRVFWEAGKRDEALEDLSRAIDLMPEDSVGYSLRGSLLTEMDRVDDAVADLTRAIELNPARAGYHLLRGRAHITGEKWELAVVDLSKALEINPRLSRAFLFRAIAQIRLGKWVAAAADLDAAIELEPDYALGYYRRGTVHVHEKRWELAKADFRKAIELDPEYLDAYTKLGDVHREVGQTIEAIAVYNQALRLSPEDSYILNSLAILGRNSGDLESASNALMRMMEIQERSRDNLILLGHAYANLGHVKLLLNDVGGAMTLLERALALPHQKADAIWLVNAGLANWRLGQYFQARSLFKRALEALRSAKEDDPATEGWLEVVTGEARSGIRRLRRYLQAQPHPDDLYNLRAWASIILSGETKIPVGVEAVFDASGEALKEKGGAGESA